MASIVQRISYLDPAGNCESIEVPEGGKGYKLHEGFVRVADPFLSGKTVMIPLHRVLLIEIYVPQEATKVAFVKPDLLQKLADEVIEEEHRRPR